MSDGIAVTEGYGSGGMTFWRTNPANNDPIFTLHPDGTVELGPGVSQEQATQAFWDAVIRMKPEAFGRARDAALEEAALLFSLPDYTPDCARRIRALKSAPPEQE